MYIGYDLQYIKLYKHEYNNEKIPDVNCNAL